jgi:hypothetical protein
MFSCRFHIPVLNSYLFTSILLYYAWYYTILEFFWKGYQLLGVQWFYLMQCILPQYKMSEIQAARSTFSFVKTGLTKENVIRAA